MRCFIKACDAITPAGDSLDEQWVKFLRHRADWNDQFANLAVCPNSGKTEETFIKHTIAKIKGLSKLPFPSDTGLIVGSSRGICDLLEQQYERFLHGKKILPSTSPRTTGSAIVTEIARNLELSGPCLQISAACSSGLHAIYLATTLLKSNQVHSILCGGIECTNTEFVREQLDRVGILTSSRPKSLRAWSFHPERKGIILGQGCAFFHLVRSEEPPPGSTEIRAISVTQESAGLTQISKNADGLQRSILNTLKLASLTVEDIDLIVAHGAGTKLGDAAEYAAYNKVFGNVLPSITATKWLTGHMLGASSAHSLALATMMLKENCFVDIPHPTILPPSHKTKRPLNNILVSSLGFGGFSASAIVSKPKL